MKKLLLGSLCCLFLCVSYAQTIPQGMKYQAVARDNAGEIIENQKIALQVKLQSNLEELQVHYTETHHVVTNQFGLFTLVIGEGEIVEGEFNQVPWSTENIWMEVAIRDRSNKDFVTISNSKLLAVPYAFHAATANQVVNNTFTPNDGGIGNSGIAASGGNGNGNNGPGVPANVWSLFGNSNTNSTSDQLGTTDAADLVMITNDLERLRITSDGDINITNSLNVGHNVDIGNDLHVGNDAVIDYDVELNFDGGSTKNYGDFSVENMSSTHLSGTLTVDKETDLNSTLNVDGETDLNSAFRVNNNSSSLLTGMLTVDGATDLNSTLDVNNGSATSLSGILGVTGATSLGNTLDVTGATTLNNTLGVTGATTLGSTLGVTGATTLSSSLGVAGTTTLGGATTINNTLAANGQVTVNASLAGAQDNYASYPLRVQGGDHGVAIKVNGTNNQRNTNWLTLFDGNGNAMGRIEGFQGLTGIARNVIIGILNEPSGSDAEGASQSKHQSPASAPPSAAQYFNNDYAVGALSETLDLVNGIIKLATNVIACLAGVGIAGDCDDAIWSAVDVLCQGVQLSGHIAYHELNLGAAFESGGADYAEWLLRDNSEEMIHFGEVVGVQGGLISKEFASAERYMVISNNPTIIGAMPDKDEASQYEKVAFMGQVPVKVVGVVEKGDYILPTGNGDGLAMAVKPDKMKALDYKRIIGIAWGESDGKELFNYIKVAVGINSNDMAGMIDRMQALMNEMQQAIQDVNPAYQPSYFPVSGSDARSISDASFSSSPTMRDIVANELAINNQSIREEAFAKIRDYSQSQNLDLSQYPHLSELMSDPNNPELAQTTLDHYSEVMQRLQDLMIEVQSLN